MYKIYKNEKIEWNLLVVMKIFLMMVVEKVLWEIRRLEMCLLLRDVKKWVKGGIEEVRLFYKIIYIELCGIICIMYVDIYFNSKLYCYYVISFFLN